MIRRALWTVLLVGLGLLIAFWAVILVGLGVVMKGVG